MKFNSKFRIFVGRIGSYEIGDKTVSVGEHDEVVIGTKDLSYKQREMIAVLVSKVNHCHY